MENKLTTEILVEETRINILRINNIDYISLTDLARYKEKDRPDHIIQNWMRTTNTVLFLGTWEHLYNKTFKPLEFEGFRNCSGENSFVLTPKKWINGVNAIGIISKQGKYGGTFAHPDIAFEFASWLSPVFKLYVIQEFERLKKNESFQKNINWKATRILSKANYVIHTDAVKNYIVPIITDEQKRFVYAEEADMLNVALFGFTSKEWKDRNPNLAKNGNMRDYASLLHLIILNNLENINAELIKMNISQSERLIKLNNIARKQMRLLEKNKSIDELYVLNDK